MEHFIANKSDCVAQDVLLTQFAGFINYTADHIAQIQNEIAYKHPYIVDVFPALNSLNDVAGINCIISAFLFLCEQMPMDMHVCKMHM